MPGLTPLRPDREYCVYCHRPAAGRCAVCHVLLCADCAVLMQGLVRPLAVCKKCAAHPPSAGRHLLIWLLVPLAILILAVLLILWLR